MKITKLYIIICFIFLTACGITGNTGIAGEACLHETSYWMSRFGVATLLIGSDNKPVHCNKES